MITGFEDITRDLDEKEKVVAAIILNGMKHKIGKDQAVTSVKIIAGLKENKGIVLTGSRLRKIMHVLHVGGALPNLVATSKGYYLSDSYKDIIQYCKSLEERIQRIQRRLDTAKRTRDWFMTGKQGKIEFL